MTFGGQAIASGPTFVMRGTSHFVESPPSRYVTAAVILVQVQPVRLFLSLLLSLICIIEGSIKKISVNISVQYFMKCFSRRKKH